MGARAERELDGCCYYLTGRGRRLPSRRQMAWALRERDCCCGAATTPPPILLPTSGLARRWWRRGAQLDGEFRFSASLTADFGPGPEAAAEGCAAIRAYPSASTPLADAGDFGPGPEEAAEGCAIGTGKPAKYILGPSADER